MSNARVIKVISITEVGQACAVSVIGTAGAPAIAYARREVGPAFAPPPPVYLNRPDVIGTFAPHIARPGADMICAVRNAFLFGPYGFVVLPDGTVIKESVLKVDEIRFKQNLDQFKVLFPGTQILWSHAPAPVLALNGYSTNNYFHFMVDNLTQLQWRDEAPQLAALPTILSGFPARAEILQPFIPAARQILGLEGAQEAAFDGTLMFCANIVFPARHMGATPLKVATLRRLFAAYRSTSRPHRLLYVDRPTGERRQLVNGNAARALAIKHGFEIVNPGALPLADQMRLFSEARMICGPHGAAFANAAFMQPGAAVLEFTHTALIETYFYDLAAASGLSYGCIVGEPAGTVTEPLNADFSIDLADMETALKAMSAVLKT